MRKLWIILVERGCGPHVPKPYGEPKPHTELQRAVTC